MAIAQKPNNDNIQERANKILQYMVTHRRFVTKEELSNYIDCGERIVRDCINWLRNNRKMVVSVSSQKGYKLILKSDVTDDDMELVKQMWCELDNRIKELESVREVCIRCWEYHEKKKRGK